MPFKVAFLGFTDFERNALTSYFRLAHNRQPAYEQVATLTDAQYLVADADHGPSVQLVTATERLDETVFVGAQAPAGHRAWMMRPIDALKVMRELDQMVAAARDARGSGWGELSPAPGPAPSPDMPPAPMPATPSAPRTRVEEAGERLAAVHEQVAAMRTRTDLPVLNEHVDLVLPTALAPPPAPHPPAVPARPAMPTPRLRVLLVDDSDLALRFLQSKLERWPLEIDEASSSGAALDLLEQRPYDLIFLDVELGPDSEMGGLELCRHIKGSAAGMNAAIVMVSVHSSEMDRVRGALAGCDAYLGKPLDDVELQRLMLRQGLKLPKDASTAKA